MAASWVHQPKDPLTWEYPENGYACIVPGSLPLSEISASQAVASRYSPGYGYDRRYYKIFSERPEAFGFMAQTARAPIVDKTKATISGTADARYARPEEPYGVFIAEARAVGRVGPSGPDHTNQRWNWIDEVLTPLAVQDFEAVLNPAGTEWIWQATIKRRPRGAIVIPRRNAIGRMPAIIIPAERSEDGTDG